MAGPVDPWDWTVDDLVANLCKSRRLWQGRPSSILPDPIALEHSLRENSMDGATMLSYVDDSIIREVLGVRPFAMRGAVRYAIEKLRSASHKYAEYTENQRSANAQDGYLSSHSATTHPDPHPNDPASSVPHVRPGEALLEDAGGKKRRRLALTNSNAPEQSSTQSLPCEPPPTASSDLVSVEASNCTGPPVAVVGPSSGDFSAEQLRPDNLFFGDTKLGERLDTSEDLDLDFSFVSNIRPNFRKHVYKQVARFLIHPERINTQRDGKSAVAIFPYPASSVRSLDASNRSALLFYRENNTPCVIREQEDLVHSGVTLRGNERAALGDGCSLTHWLQEDNKSLPPLDDDSDTESFSASVWEEIQRDIEEDEEVKTQVERETLTSDEVEDIIDRKIEELVEAWKRKKLPLREKGAWSLWKRSRHPQSRSKLQKYFAQEVERLNERLARLRKGILDELWRKATDLERQGEIFEETIYQREDCVWRLSVLAQKTAPQRRNRPLKTITSRRQANPRENAEDSEELGSDSVASTDDNPEDFIEPDEDTNAGIEMDVDIPSLVDKTLTNGEFSQPHQHPTVAHSSSPQIKESPSHQVEVKSSDPVTIIDLTSDRGNETDKASQSGTAATSHASMAIPAMASTSEVAKWAWSELEEKNDRKRLLVKIFREQTQPARDTMKKRILHDGLGSKAFVTELRQFFSTTIQDASAQSDRRARHLRRLAQLALSWHYCNHKFMLDEVKPEHCQTFLEELDDDGSDLQSFYRLLRSLLIADNTRVSPPLGGTSSPPRIRELGDKDAATVSSTGRSTSPDDDNAPILTPSKHRKRPVKQDRTAAESRLKAQKRQEDQEQNERRFEEERGTMASAPTQGSQVIINPGTSGNDPEKYVFISSRISNRILPHQISGVRFMWREVVSANHDGDDDEMQGCLLAHTMGLGKTMQAITLLVTICEAGRSKNPKISSQIPESLRVPRILILCPAALIQNWLNELRSWVPVPYEENIGHICHVDADQTVSERIRTVDSWCSSKGILMMSYDMFRILVSRKDKQKDKSREDDKTLTEISRQLLNGPDVVVADEAHFLKNPGSNISQYASQIRTKSRIALTGSPLSNSLREYYAMINWIAPGYLGNPIEFKAKYQEPIEMGLYKDSSHADWRYALKSLRILEKNIGPKLDRKDFADVESQLPRKVEFVLTVPFHDVQREAYKRFVECQEAGIMTQKTINLATLWAWLTAISLLVNHPFIFLEKLKDRHSQALRAEGSRENSDDEIPANPDQQEENPSIWKSILADDAIDQQIRALQTISDLKDPRFSPKMALLLQIVRLSKEAGDKVLVFSHSIPTLNYIEALLQRESELIYERLDGKTKVSDRQNMANNFNEGRVDLFLISTRAGGQGFNLQGANRVVIFDFAFNPGWETQAIGRAYRITQKKPVFVYRFIAGEGYEAELYKTAAYKTQLAYRVVDKINPVRASSKPSDYLFSPRPIKKNDVQGLRGKDPKVLDKLLDSAGSLIFDLATTDTLREEADEKLTKEEEQEAENEYQRRLQEKNPATLAPGAVSRIGYSNTIHGLPSPRAIPRTPGFQSESAASAPQASFALNTMISGPGQGGSASGFPPAGPLPARTMSSQPLFGSSHTGGFHGEPHGLPMPPSSASLQGTNYGFLAPARNLVGGPRTPAFDRAFSQNQGPPDSRSHPSDPRGRGAPQPPGSSSSQMPK